ncbi:hypothetical protein CLAIMM_00285 [Cladophialophora immunda]|nr:hypothetical protein CLAIMM_00285 [Cladophialophora immunda]
MMALVPQEADSATIESCNVTFLTSNRTIGARYDCLGPGNGKESKIFAQFGRIFCVSPLHYSRRRWLEEDDDCHDTGFVLALGLQSSGLADEFYIICNLTRDDGCKEMTAEEIYGHPDLLQFCNTEDQFTVARVESRGLDLLLGSWEEIDYFDEQDKKIQLTKLSDRIPEIVETGWRQDSNGDKSLETTVYLGKNGKWKQVVSSRSSQ